MTEQRDFKGIWIDKQIWLDKRLNALEKVILMEIDSLDNEETGCYASNKYIAEFCQCSETKTSTAISKLIDLDYIYLKSFDGRTRILKSRLSKNERQTLNNLKADIKIFKDNNKLNNKENKEDNIYIKIVDYLNEKAGTEYKSTTPATQTLIKARLNEKFTFEDFKTVIDKKSKSWLGTDFAKYLRPKTLFGTNFESYLNEKIHQVKSEIISHNYSKDDNSKIFDSLDDTEI